MTKWLRCVVTGWYAVSVRVKKKLNGLDRQGSTSKHRIRQIETSEWAPTAKRNAFKRALPEEAASHRDPRQPTSGHSRFRRLSSCQQKSKNQSSLGFQRAFWIYDVISVSQNFASVCPQTRLQSMIKNPPRGSRIDFILTLLFLLLAAGTGLNAGRKNRPQPRVRSISPMIATFFGRFGVGLYRAAQAQHAFNIDRLGAGGTERDLRFTRCFSIRTLCSPTSA